MIELEDNTRLYFAYLTLEDKILSYYPVYEGVTSGKDEPGKGYFAPPQFVAHVDEQVGRCEVLLSHSMHRKQRSSVRCTTN